MFLHTDSKNNIHTSYFDILNLFTLLLLKVFYTFPTDNVSGTPRAAQPRSRILWGSFSVRLLLSLDSTFRRWRISITTMTGIGLTGASAGGEGKDVRVRGAVRRGRGGRCVRARVCGTSSGGRPRSSSRYDE